MKPVGIVLVLVALIGAMTMDHENLGSLIKISSLLLLAGGTVVVQVKARGKLSAFRSREYRCLVRERQTYSLL